jgi:hypothetical protein
MGDATASGNTATCEIRTLESSPTTSPPPAAHPSLLPATGPALVPPPATAFTAAPSLSCFCAVYHGK